MPRTSRISLGVLTGCLLVASSSPAATGEEFTFYHENVMGTSLELRVRADDAEAAHRAEARVLDEIARLSAIFSGYDDKSEFARWQRTSGTPVPVASELFTVLRAADGWRQRSDGAFDPEVEVLTRLWSRCAGLGRTPTVEEIAAARAQMAHEAWSLDPITGTASRLSDCPLSLNAIAKGFIVERACAVAMEGDRDIRGLLLNVGGDLRACGDKPWTVGLAPARGDSASTEPVAFVSVQDRSVATSGNAFRGFSIAGHRYSHILDPRTGRPVDRTIAATVIAPRGADADALATAFNVLSVEESLSLAESVPGVACRLVSRDGHVTHSAGWPRDERPVTRLLASAESGESKDQGQDSSGDDHELVVNFEINRPDTGTGPYRRPYVVVFVEDAEGLSVRTVSLWVSRTGAGPDQWLPDLRRWYRGDASRSLAAKKSMVFTIGRPTRPAGTYSVIWDGKDDLGKPVGPGTYTIFIEAAREHGTHQLIRTRVTLADEPFVERLQGNVEIRSASVEYRRKSASK